jgi:kynureninase
MMDDAGESVATRERIVRAVAELGGGSLTQDGIARHIAPLFSRVLARNRERIYLANHSLGRPLDAVEEDVREALAAWYGRMGGAWEVWEAEGSSYRKRLAQLLGAPRADCVVPKSSAGQGLRAVLNSYDAVPRVVSTRGEFDSLDVILREYARRGRIALTLVEPRTDGMFAVDDLAAAILPDADLVVVSSAMFQTGQLLVGIEALIESAHRVGAHVLVDVYHTLGAVPVNINALDVDFAVGGSYKYLRGGPGACFLYIAPRLLDAGLATLDIGWFAKERAFAHERPDPPRLAAGGNAWLESTPPVLPWFQARAGQLFTLDIGVARLRAYSLRQQARLSQRLGENDIATLGPAEDRGAFVAVHRADAAELAARMGERRIDVDARGPWLRLCPDLLTTEEEIDRAAATLAGLMG